MNNLPKARDFEIVVQQIDDEVLVYDLASNKAHCLNETVAAVWQNCDGKSSVSAIARRRKIPEEFVSFAIDELQRANLMSESMDMGIPDEGLSRRKMLIKAGAVAVALPLITSVVAPHAVQAQSTTCLGPCGIFNLNPTPFFVDIQACVDALQAAALTQCCSGVLNGQGGFIFGTNPELCRGFCGTIQGSCIIG